MSILSFHSHTYYKIDTIIIPIWWIRLSYLPRITQLVDKNSAPVHLSKAQSLKRHAEAPHNFLMIPLCICRILISQLSFSIWQWQSFANLSHVAFTDFSSSCSSVLSIVCPWAHHPASRKILLIMWLIVLVQGFKETNMKEHTGNHSSIPWQ